VVDRLADRAANRVVLAAALTHNGWAGVTDVRSYQAYARPNTTPRIKKEKYTLCAEWTMMPIQVLRNRQLGNAYRKTPLITDARIPQGWWAWYEP
jgi:hypothetical protein